MPLMLAAPETVQSRHPSIPDLFTAMRKFAKYIDLNILKVPAVHTIHITLQFTICVSPQILNRVSCWSIYALFIKNVEMSVYTGEMLLSLLAAAALNFQRSNKRVYLQ